MNTATLGPDPLESLIGEVLGQLAGGIPPSKIEIERVDVKEEPGRRSRSDDIGMGSPTSEKAADALAGEMACMANTPGGGALIVGIADDGRRVGTELEAEWLRHRIWELTSRKLTTAVRAQSLDGCRILVLSCVEAFEPISYRGKLRWRVGSN